MVTILMQPATYASTIEVILISSAIAAAIGAGTSQLSSRRPRAWISGAVFGTCWGLIGVFVGPVISEIFRLELGGVAETATLISTTLVGAVVGGWLSGAISSGTRKP